MKAVGYYIVLEALKTPVKKTSGGLLLGEKQREDIRYGKGAVVEVGDKVAAVEKGDIVWFDKAAAHALELDMLYTVIRETDVVIIE